MIPKASIIAIGTELLKGSVVNTNASLVSKTLYSLGFQVQSHFVCHDRISEIEDCLGQALSHADAVILSGGLGPTPDDVTRDALAHFFKVPLEISKPQINLIKKYYRRTGKRFPKMVEKEALYPSNAKPLVNRQGIALGFYIPCGGKVVVVLPGVPLELEKMLHRQVVPLLNRYFKKIRATPGLTAKIVGLSEPVVMEKLKKNFFDRDFEFGIYPEPGQVTIRINAPQKSVINVLKKRITQRLSPYVYSTEEQSLAEAVGPLLLRRKKSLAVAESCTGGQLAAEITQVPGASRYFKGALTVYGNESKRLLGVTKEDLKRHGAVSSRVALLLALNVRKVMDSDYGIGITGIAGPTGARPGKPVGTVFIAVAGPKKSTVKPCLFWGNRAQVQKKATIKALQLLRQALL